MKKQIRRGVFETNSSSTHSITMCMESDYNKWEKGELLLYVGWRSFYKKDNRPERNHLYTIEEAIEFEKSRCDSGIDWNNKQEVDLALADSDFYTYERYWNEYCEDYEDYEETMTTPNGEKVVAFGYYGWEN